MPHGELPEHTVYFPANQSLPRGSRLTVFHAPDNEAGLEWALFYSDRQSIDPLLHIAQHGPAEWVAYVDRDQRRLCRRDTLMDAVYGALDILERERERDPR